jgi:choice-of-anchor A domain-containing protein
MRSVAFALAFAVSGCTLVPGKNSGPAGAGSPSPQDLKPADPVFAYNVLAFGDATLNDSAIQGRLAVGGDAKLERYQVGAVLSEDANRCDLSVGGNLDFTDGSVYQGRICVRGSIHTDAVGTKFPGTGTVPEDFSALAADAAALSKRLAAAAPAMMVDEKYMNGGAARIVLKGDAADFNVFEVATGALQLATGLLVSVPAGSSAIVNITGDSVSMTQLGIVLDGSDASTTLFNVPDGTALTLRGVNILGTVLAPKAAFKFDDGTLTGGVVADSVQASGRFNMMPYAGKLAGQ